MAAAPVQQQQALTEQQRQAQVANQQAFLAEFVALWALLDAQALDATTDAWAAAALRLIREFRLRSARLAVEFYETLRRLAVPDTPTPMPIVLLPGDRAPREPDLDARGDLSDALADVLRADAAARRAARRVRIPLTVRIDFKDRDPAVDATLRITGPVNIKSRVKRAQPVREAARTALVEASGAASRHVLDGGRATNLALVHSDRAAIGWIRVTDSNPCSFCAMLASRGITWGRYARESFKASNEKFAGGVFDGQGENDPRVTGRGQVKVHDHCACGIAVIFDRRDPLLQRNNEYRQLWNDHIRGRYSGNDAVRAWRRLYERPEVFKRKAREGHAA